MFLGEIKNTIYTHNIDNASFLAVNLTARGKGSNKSIRINNYNSTKYDDIAFKIASSPSIYLELEYINYSQNPIFTESIIFSQSELVNFLNWFIQAKEYFFKTPNLRYQTQTPNLYPDLGFSSDGINVGIWKLNTTETRGLCYIPINVLFFIVEEIMFQVRNNFIFLATQMAGNYLQAYLSMENMLLLSNGVSKNTQQTQPQTNTGYANVEGFKNPNTSNTTKQYVEQPLQNNDFGKNFVQGVTNSLNNIGTNEINDDIQPTETKLNEDFSNFENIDFAKIFRESQDDSELGF